MKNSRRKWIKIHCDSRLRGSLRSESPTLRGVFADLLAMAGDNAYGEDGMIQLAEDIGFNDRAIGSILNVPLKEWLSAKERLSNHPDPSENRIEILPLSQGFAIRVINWKKYQSEYDRVKGYQAEYRSRRKSLAQEKAPFFSHDTEDQEEKSSSPLDEEADEEIDEEGEGDQECKASSLTLEKEVSNLTANLTPRFSPLPDIPSYLDFKVQDRLREMKRDILKKRVRLFDERSKGAHPTDALESSIDKLTQDFIFEIKSRENKWSPVEK